MKDAGVHRYLMHSTFDPRLAALTVRNHKMIGAQVKKAATRGYRNNCADIDFDNGASFHFVKTRHSREYAIPADRLALAMYLSAMAVKIRYTIWLMSDIGLRVPNASMVSPILASPLSYWYNKRPCSLHLLLLLYQYDKSTLSC